MASLEVDHFQDLFLGYDPPSKEMPFVGAYFRKSPIHKEVHILTLVLSEGQELNMTPTPDPSQARIWRLQMISSSTSCQSHDHFQEVLRIGNAGGENAFPGVHVLDY